MKKHLPFIFLIFIFCLWSLSSLFQSGFMYSHDSLWHVQRIQNIFTLIPTQFPVRWSPDLDNGFGIPLFNFAYPAPYYLAALAMFMGLGPIKAYYALLFLSYLAGGVGIYLLGHRQRFAGLIAAILYLLTPYQFLDIFVRGALGEVVALGLIPWVVLSYRQISRSGQLRWYNSLPMAFLLLSHNFYAYLFTGLLTLLTLFRYQHKLKITLSYLLSIALSAFFLLPAFFERSSLLITQTTDYGFQSHFVYPHQLLYSPWSYQGSLPGNSSVEMSFQLGVANIIIIIIALIILASKFRQRTFPKRLFLYIVITFFLIFMTLSPSLWLWHNLPLISSLQFPWRFLGIATFLFPLLYLELAQIVSSKHRRFFRILSIALVVLAFYNTRNYHRPVKRLSSEEFLTLHYEYVGKTTTAHRDELVPRWSAKERWHDNSPTLQLDNEVELIRTHESLYGINFVATTPHSDSYATYAKNYYPAWVGYQDQGKISLLPTQTGEIRIPLAEGEHYYEIAIANTPIAIFANYTSLLAIIVLGIIAWKGSNQ